MRCPKREWLSVTLWGLGLRIPPWTRRTQVIECFETYLAHRFTGECFGVDALGELLLRP